MFRMIGNKIELYRYKITYIEYKQEQIKKCISEVHKNEMEQKLISKELEFTTTVIDQSVNEWFNELEFNSYDEALDVFNTGQFIYEQKIQQQELIDNLKLRADVDYVAIMIGVEI